MKILRIVLAVVGGIIIGSIINMGILELGPHLISNPEGFDNSTKESLAATIHLLKPQNFITVFFAHSLGVLVGTFFAAKITVNRKLIVSSIIGAFFLFGGIYMISILPDSPTWFNILDLMGAYIPMTWIGWKLAGGNK